MTDTKRKLKHILSVEKKLYLSNSALKHRLVRTKNFYIFRYLVFLRKEEYYRKRNLLLYLFYKRKKNRLGMKLGFDIPAGTCDEGLLIHHVGLITINKSAKIGKNCDIAGCFCAGGTDKGAPVIEDNVSIGYGVSIIGNVVVGNSAVIGAGAVVTKNCEKGRVYAGVPAKKIEIKER